MKWYVLQAERSSPDGDDWFCLVGPFDDEESADAYALDPEHGDDQRRLVVRFGELRQYAVFERGTFGIEIAQPEPPATEDAIVERVKAARNKRHPRAPQ